MIDLWVRYISKAFWGQDDALSFELPQSEESTSNSVQITELVICHHPTNDGINSHQ